ncbi:MAG: hypothetical protein QXR06_00600, partial [Candidatus Bathyarchaeia archaeon]
NRVGFKDGPEIILRYSFRIYLPLLEHEQITEFQGRSKSSRRRPRNFLRFKRLECYTKIAWHNRKKHI